MPIADWTGSRQEVRSLPPHISAYLEKRKTINYLVLSTNLSPLLTSWNGCLVSTAYSWLWSQGHRWTVRALYTQEPSLPFHRAEKPNNFQPWATCESRAQGAVRLICPVRLRRYFKLLTKISTLNCFRAITKLHLNTLTRISSECAGFGHTGDFGFFFLSSQKGLRPASPGSLEFSGTQVFFLCGLPLPSTRLKHMEGL